MKPVAKDHTFKKIKLKEKINILAISYKNLGHLLAFGKITAHLCNQFKQKLHI